MTLVRFAVSRAESVTKTLPLSGMIIAGLIGVIFLADLAAGFPFQRVSIGLDVGFLVSAVIVGYLSWTLLEKARR
jgi:hypothetical protein